MFQYSWGPKPGQTVGISRPVSSLKEAKKLALKIVEGAAAQGALCYATVQDLHTGLTKATYATAELAKELAEFSNVEYV